MEEDLEEVDSEREAVSYRVSKGPDGGCKVAAGGKDYAPEEISAMVLRKLKGRCRDLSR
ncbi:MAG: Hsp70 family protein [Cyanobacteriota/Melainabacteria group bacterium]